MSRGEKKARGGAGTNITTSTVGRTTTGVPGGATTAAGRRRPLPRATV